jgi:hypothetical protein
MSRRRPIALVDASRGNARPTLQRADGQRFRTIDGDPHPPSTAAKNVSPNANSDLSASASAIGHSKHPTSAFATTVDKKSRFFIRKPHLKLRKIPRHLDQIDEYECATKDPQTEEVGVDASLSSSSSFNTLSSFPSAAVNSYSALINEFDDYTRGSQISCLTTNSTPSTEYTLPMTNSESSAAAGAVERSQNPTSALAATGRRSDVSTFSSPSFRAFKDFVLDNKKDEELSELVTSLQETNIQQENTIHQLLHHITKIESKLQSQREPTKVESIERTQKPMNDPPAQSDDSNDSLYQLQKINDDLEEKTGLLTYENERPLSKCQRIERDETQCKELLVLVEYLRAENNDIRALVSRMSDKLVNLEQVHEDCMKGYETKLASLRDAIHRAELSKEDLNMKWSIENEEAYQLCEVLQQEIDMLRESLEESRGRRESGSKENENEGERENKLANLPSKRVSWANGNCPRIQQQPSNVLCDGQDGENGDDRRDSILANYENHQLRSNCLEQEGWEYHHEEHIVNNLKFLLPFPPL